MNSNENPLLQKVQNTNSNPTVISNEPEEEFLCLICQRKFKTKEKLKIHEEMSPLHKVDN